MKIIKSTQVTFGDGVTFAWTHATHPESEQCLGMMILAKPAACLGDHGLCCTIKNFVFGGIPIWRCSFLKPKLLLDRDKSKYETFLTATLNEALREVFKRFDIRG